MTIKGGWGHPTPNCYLKKFELSDKKNRCETLFLMSHLMEFPLPNMYLLLSLLVTHPHAIPWLRIQQDGTQSLINIYNYQIFLFLFLFLLFFMFLHLSVSYFVNGVGVHTVIPPGADTPQERTPPRSRHSPGNRDGYCCARYASYWNAFLLMLHLLKL